jgi:predicted peptidase
VPLCGGGDPRKAARFKDVPIWAFQGAKDDLVPAERSREMVEALRRIGGRVRYTEFPDADHNCRSTGDIPSILHRAAWPENPVQNTKIREKIIARTI